MIEFLYWFETDYSMPKIPFSRSKLALAFLRPRFRISTGNDKGSREGDFTDHYKGTDSKRYSLTFGADFSISFETSFATAGIFWCIIIISSICNIITIGICTALTSSCAAFWRSFAFDIWEAVGFQPAAVAL